MLAFQEIAASLSYHFATSLNQTYHWQERPRRSILGESWRACLSLSNKTSPCQHCCLPLSLAPSPPQRNIKSNKWSKTCRIKTQFISRQRDVAYTNTSLNITLHRKQAGLEWALKLPGSKTVKPIVRETFLKQQLQKTDKNLSVGWGVPPARTKLYSFSLAYYYLTTKSLLKQ